MQAVVPADAAYLPAAHTTHPDVPPDENVPAGQLLHEFAEKHAVPAVHDATVQVSVQ